MFSQHLAVQSPQDSLISGHTDKRSEWSQAPAQNHRASDPVVGLTYSKA